MQPRTLLIIAAAAALVSACHREAPQSRSQSSPSAGASQTQSAPTTPADMGKPTQDEKREGANPTQGQVDPKESAQHRDFQHKGDAQGPTSPDTTPRK